MGLLTDTLLQSATDKLARIYQEFSLFIAVSADPSITTGQTLLVAANQLLDVTVVQSDDYNVEADLNSAFFAVASGLNAQSIMSENFGQTLTAINTHYAGQSGQDGFAAYLLSVNNPTGLDNDYTTLIDPWFQDFWFFVNGTPLDLESVMSKPIHPDWRGEFYPDAQAMGDNSVGGAFVAGYPVEDTYGAVVPTVEVTTDFAGGGAAPTVVIAGTDDLGNAGTWTATVTGGNNPASAVATTITPSVTTAAARLTVAVGSLTGIVVGSVLTVNAGDADEETILVEVAGAGNITAVFLRNHGAGSALTGKLTFVTVAGTVGRRLREVTNITIGTTGHSAGAVRVTGLPERIAI